MRSLYLLALLLPLSACDLLGIPDPTKAEATREADGKAVGSACRQAGRALEDCYTLNTSASKAAVFAGWREMNDYMLENKLEIVKPEIPSPAIIKRKMAIEAAEQAQTSELSEKPAGEAGRKPDKESADEHKDIKEISYLVLKFANA